MDISERDPETVLAVWLLLLSLCLRPLATAECPAIMTVLEARLTRAGQREWFRRYGEELAVMELAFHNGILGWQLMKFWAAVEANPDPWVRAALRGVVHLTEQSSIEEIRHARRQVRKVWSAWRREQRRTK